MLYPARWKKITVDQSKVLKIDCSGFFGATRYRSRQQFVVIHNKSNESCNNYAPLICEDYIEVIEFDLLIYGIKGIYRYLSNQL